MDALACEERDISDLEEGLDEVVKSVAELLIGDIDHEFAVSVFDMEHRQGVGDDCLSVSAKQVLFIDVVGEVHKRVSFVGERPLVVVLFKHNCEMVAVVESERCEDAEPANAFGDDPEISGDFLLEF